MIEEQRASILLIQQHQGRVTVSVAAAQWIRTPAGKDLALVNLPTTDTRELSLAELIKLAAGQLDLDALPAGGALEPHALPAATEGAAPGSAGAAAEARAVTHTERVTGGQILEEHYERVRKRIARTAAQDGVTVGEIAFETKGNLLIGRAPIVSGGGLPS